MKTIITDEEICNANRKVLLETGDFSASFISWLDKKLGFTTKLLNYEYNPLTYLHTFIVEPY